MRRGVASSSASADYDSPFASRTTSPPSVRETNKKSSTTKESRSKRRHRRDLEDVQEKRSWSTKDQQKRPRLESDKKENSERRSSSKPSVSNPKTVLNGDKGVSKSYHRDSIISHDAPFKKLSRRKSQKLWQLFNDAEKPVTPRKEAFLPSSSQSTQRRRLTPDYSMFLEKKNLLSPIPPSPPSSRPLVPNQQVISPSVSKNLSVRQNIISKISSRHMLVNDSSNNSLFFLPSWV